MRFTPFFLALFFFAFVSCSKEAGIGGMATLTGKVRVQQFNSSGIMIAEYDAPDERVYIIYGDNPVYDDETRTHFDGTYRFEYLKKGSYIVFAYSDCPTCPSGVTAVQRTIEIAERKTTVQAEDLIIAKY